MKKTSNWLLISALIAASFAVTPIASAETTVKIKNCVNTSTGAARLVANSVTKCRKGEKLFYFEIPVLDDASYSILHSGKGAPVDNLTGHDGDFYIDTTANQIYGPRTLGAWGSPHNLSGVTGPSGNTILSGDRAPSIFIGIPGDFYFDVETKRMYGPKTDRDGWGAGVVLAGPAGTNGAQGPQGPQGIQGSQGPAGGFGAYGAFHDTSTLTLTINTATPIPLNTTDMSNGVSIVDGSKITFSTAGRFNIAFSSQIIKDDTGEDTISIWLCKGVSGNGCTNVPWSNTDLLLAGAGVRHVAAWNFFVSANVGDYFQLLISSSGTTLKTKIVSLPAQTNPVRPEIPATILTVNQVGAS